MKAIYCDSCMVGKNVCQFNIFYNGKISIFDEYLRMSKNACSVPTYYIIFLNQIIDTNTILTVP